ncbi:tannase [Ilyonectria robusta]
MASGWWRNLALACGDLLHISCHAWPCYVPLPTTQLKLSIPLNTSSKLSIAHTPATMSASLFNGTISPSACSAGTFPYPIIPEVRFLSLEANLVHNLSINVPLGGYPNHGPVNVTSAGFCNVSTTYTHPSGDDSVNVQVWLPTDIWNGRLQGIGGGGWSAGLPDQAPAGMAAAVGEGYATYGTDAGLGPQANGLTPESWAMGVDGKPQLRLLENLASASLYEGAIIAKNFTAAFYDEPARYSYFSGCSQGGRQGMALAQRYPDLFDGIAAAAPAINWNSLFVGGTYANFLMNLYGVYPPSCEIEALISAAIKACDGLDGVLDGIISDPGACDFDPVNLVGTRIECAAGSLVDLTRRLRRDIDFIFTI